MNKTTFLMCVVSAALGAIFTIYLAGNLHPSFAAASTFLSNPVQQGALQQPVFQNPNLPSGGLANGGLGLPQQQAGLGNAN